MPEVKKMSIGVDLGGTKIAAGLCNDGKILKKVIFPTRAENGFESVVKVIAEAVASVKVSVDEKTIAGIGIGAAGQINSRSGEVLYAPNLNWNKKPLGAAVKKLTGMSVKVINDVRAATVAEQKYGNGKDCKNFVNIFVGTGIGSGFVLNGKLLTGTTNSAGEIGHICMDPKGPVCGCGKKGCLEAFASGTALENFVRHGIKQGKKSIITELCEGNLNNIRGPLIGEAARKGDELALAGIRQVGIYLGLALANLHTMLNPELILLGGGVMALKEFFMKDLETTMKKHILPVADRESGLIDFARFENDAVILGGAALFS